VTYTQIRRELLFIGTIYLGTTLRRDKPKLAQRASNWFVTKGYLPKSQERNEVFAENLALGQKIFTPKYLPCISFLLAGKIF
jgi:hypothetical protein